MNSLEDRDHVLRMVEQKDRRFSLLITMENFLQIQILLSPKEVPLASVDLQH